MLDVTSRSLSSDRDIVTTTNAAEIADGKAILKEDSCSWTVKVVEKITNQDGARYKNKLVRKLTWEKRNGIERSTVITSAGSSIDSRSVQRST